jgi:hypothetical protein
MLCSITVATDVRYVKLIWSIYIFLAHFWTRHWDINMDWYRNCGIRTYWSACCWRRWHFEFSSIRSSLCKANVLSFSTQVSISGEVLLNLFV